MPQRSFHIQFRVDKRKRRFRHWRGFWCVEPWLSVNHVSTSPYSKWKSFCTLYYLRDRGGEDEVQAYNWRKHDFEITVDPNWVHLVGHLFGGFWEPVPGTLCRQRGGHVHFPATKSNQKFRIRWMWSSTKIFHPSFHSGVDVFFGYPIIPSYSVNLIHNNRNFTELWNRK